MERLTTKSVNGRPIFKKMPPYEEYEPVRRLAAIKDILGDDYNLDHLRELVEADRNQEFQRQLKRFDIMPPKRYQKENRETDYISREAALDRFTYEKGKIIPETIESGEENTVSFKDVKSVLRSFPAADVALVVHGEWIEKDGDLYCSNCWYQIPDCAGNATVISRVENRYCYFCGAKMDGGDSK